MAVKILSWNLCKFPASLVQTAARVTRLIDVVSPVAGPLADIFVVLEPVIGQNYAPGTVARGQGVISLTALLAKLQTRYGPWRLMPTISLAQASNKAETIGVFYDSSKVQPTGPHDLDYAPAPFDAATSGQGTVFWLDTMGGASIDRVDADGMNHMMVVSGPKQPTEFKLEAKTKKVYWINAQGGQEGIFWSPFAGGAATQIHNSTMARELAVDSVNGKVFWVEGMGAMPAEIWWSDLTGMLAAMGPGTLVADGAASDLFADGEYSYLYWVNGVGVLRSCDFSKMMPAAANHIQVPLPGGMMAPGPAAGPLLDATGEGIYWVEGGPSAIARLADQMVGRELILNAAAAGTPMSLNLDVHGRRIFWVDTAAGDINSADLDGMNAATPVPTAQAGTPSSLALDPSQNAVFWTDAATGNVNRADLDGMNVMALKAAGTPTRIAVAPGPVVGGGATHVAAGGGGALNFPNAGERNPLLVKFQELASMKDFFVVAAHSPSPDHAMGHNANARMGTLNLGKIKAITSHRAGTPVVVVGDFNSCLMPNDLKDVLGNDDDRCNVNKKAHHDLDPESQATMIGPGASAYAQGRAAIDAIRAAVSSTDHGYQASVHNDTAVAALAAGAAQTAADNATDEANKAGKAARDAVTLGKATMHAGLPGWVAAGVPVEITNAEGLGKPAGGGMLAAYQAHALNALALAKGARDKALVVVGALKANTTPYIQAVAQAVAGAAATFDAVAAAHAVNSLAYTKGTGAAVLAAEAAVTGGNVVPAAAAKAVTANAKGTLAMNAMGGGAFVTLAKDARDAALDIEAELFQSHIFQTRTSLSPAFSNYMMMMMISATSDDYKAHAFDHVITVGFAEVSDAKVVDPVDEAITAHKAMHMGMIAQMDFNDIYDKWYRGNGLSDHLAVYAKLKL